MDTVRPPMSMFLSMEDLYQQFPAARLSAELDLGVWWTWRPNEQAQRLTFVAATGHLVLVRADGSVDLLAKLKAFDGSDPAKAGAAAHELTERLLPDWAEWCRPEGLRLVHHRLWLLLLDGDDAVEYVAPWTPPTPPDAHLEQDFEDRVNGGFDG